MSALWFPGSAWEPVAREALPCEAEPRVQWRAQAEPGNEELEERAVDR
jgi:hypothetical protein